MHQPMQKPLGGWVDALLPPCFHTDFAASAKSCVEQLRDNFLIHGFNVQKHILFVEGKAFHED